MDCEKWFPISFPYLIPAQELKPLERESFICLVWITCLHHPSKGCRKEESIWFTVSLRRYTMRKKLPNLDFIKSGEGILERPKLNVHFTVSFTTEVKSSDNSLWAHHYLPHVLRCQLEKQHREEVSVLILCFLLLCNKLAQTYSLEHYKFITLQFCRSGIQYSLLLKV